MCACQPQQIIILNNNKTNYLLFFYIYFILFNYSILHVNLFPQACILPISNHPVILNTSHVRNLLDDYGSLLCCKGREQVVTLCLSGPVLIRRWRSSLHWMVQSMELLDLLHDSLWGQAGAQLRQS